MSANMEIDKRLEMSLDDVIKQARDKSRGTRAQGGRRGRGRGAGRASNTQQRAQQSAGRSTDARQAALASKRGLPDTAQNGLRVMRGSTITLRGRGRGGRARGRGRGFQPDYVDDPSDLTISIVNERAFAQPQQRLTPSPPGFPRSAPYAGFTAAAKAGSIPLRRPPVSGVRSQQTSAAQLGRSGSRGAGDSFLRDDWQRGDSTVRARRADPYGGGTGALNMDIESDNYTVRAVPPAARPYR